MDVLPFDIANETPVIITLPEGTFTGILKGAGWQSQERKYFVLLDDATGFPRLPPGELVAVVPKDIVKVNAERLTQ